MEFDAKKFIAIVVVLLFNLQFDSQSGTGKTVKVQVLTKDLRTVKIMFKYLGSSE